MPLHISTDATKAPEHRKAVSLTVQDVMTPQPLTIGRGESLATAREMMQVHRCRHLPVLEHGELVGVMTERDLYLLETVAGLDLAGDDVSDAMTTDAYAVPPDAPLSEVARQMATERYGCAVVIERGRVIGIFTTTDALRVLAGSST
jgi:acetoin utilization protein AcuB